VQATAVWGQSRGDASIHAPRGVHWCAPSQSAVFTLMPCACRAAALELGCDPCGIMSSSDRACHTRCHTGMRVWLLASSGEAGAAVDTGSPAAHIVRT